jgi:hypothetical protein
MTMKTTMKWRSESVLDLYNLVCGLVLFFSPWLFAYASKDARVDLWTSGAVIAATSIVAVVAFANWEVAEFAAGSLVDGVPLGAGLYAHQGDAYQYRSGRDGCVHRSA